MAVLGPVRCCQAGDGARPQDAAGALGRAHGQRLAAGARALGGHGDPADRRAREARPARADRLRPDPRARVGGARHQDRVCRRLSRLLLRADLRSAAPARDLRAAQPAGLGPARGDVRGDGAQRLQEDPDHQRPRRQPEPAALLRAGAARTSTRLRRLLPRSGARSGAERADDQAAQVGPGRATRTPASARRRRCCICGRTWSSRIAPAASRAPTRSVWSCPTSIPGSGGTAPIPNHYAGDGAVATRELGQLITEHRIASIVKALRTIKADTVTPELQQEFFDRVGKD